MLSFCYKKVIYYILVLELQALLRIQEQLRETFFDNFVIFFFNLEAFTFKNLLSRGVALRITPRPSWHLLWTPMAKTLVTLCCVLGSYKRCIG